MVNQQGSAFMFEDLENEDIQEEEATNTDTVLQSYTQRYLSELEQSLYDEVQTRKSIDSVLFFLTAQVTSISLSWLLFHLQLSLVAIRLLSALVAIIPGLISLGDGFNLNISSESWKMDLSRNPLISLTKVGVGVGLNYIATKEISTAVEETKIQINQAYSDISKNDTPLLIGNTLAYGALFLVALGVVIYSWARKK